MKEVNKLIGTGRKGIEINCSINWWISPGTIIRNSGELGMYSQSSSSLSIDNETYIITICDPVYWTATEETDFTPEMGPDLCFVDTGLDWEIRGNFKCNERSRKKY